MDDRNPKRFLIRKPFAAWAVGLGLCGLLALANPRNSLGFIVVSCSYPLLIGYIVKKHAALLGWAAALFISWLGAITHVCRDVRADRGENLGTALVFLFIVTCPFGLLFGALGRVLRRVPIRLAWILIISVWLIPGVAAFSFKPEIPPGRPSAIVARFPAGDRLGCPLAVAPLEDGLRFAWFALGEKGRSIDVLDGAANAKAGCVRTLPLPESTPRLQRHLASCDASGTHVAVAGPRGVVVWNHRTGKMIRTIEHKAPVLFARVALSPVTPCLAYSFSSPAPEVHITRLEQPFDPTCFKPETTAPATSLRFSHDGRFVAAATGYPDGILPTKGGEILVMDAAKREISATIDVRHYFKMTGDSVGISDVAFHPGDPEHKRHQTIGASLNGDPPAFIFHSLTGGWRGTAFSPSPAATAFAFSSDGYGQARGYVNGQVIVEDVCPQDCQPDTDGPFERWKSHMTDVAKCDAPVELLRFLHGYRLLAANDLVLDLRELLHPDSPHRGYWTRREFWQSPEAGIEQ